MKLYHLQYWKFITSITFNSPLIQFIPNLQICTGTNDIYENQYILIFSFLQIELQLCYDKSFNFKLNTFIELF